MDVTEHRCYLQVEKTPKKLRHQRRERATTGQQTLRANNVEGKAVMDDDDDEPLQPLHVFFDIESMQVDGRHVPNLVVGETADDDPPVRFLGETCLCDFLYWFDTLTLNGTQPLTVLAHNI